MSKNDLVKSGVTACFVAFCIVLALGAVVEIIEYWGFVQFGHGEGFLGFGNGDNSSNFGPWENSSIDLTNNLIGSFTGVFIYAIRLGLRKHVVLKKSS
jgi:uncharacterized membrane protein YjdF